MMFKHPEYFYAIIPMAIILFILMRQDFVKFKDFREQSSFRKERRLTRFVLFVSRVIIFSLLIAALAQPYELKTESVPGNPFLNILVDNSNSMELFPNSISQKLSTEISKSIPVSMKTIAESNISAIGDGILSNIQGDDNVILISDGNNNHGRSLGDIMLLASSLNTTISAIRTESKSSDAVIKIEGPSETTADVENQFEIIISQTGTIAPYNLKAYIDGQLAIDESITGAKTIQFRKKLAEGYHQISAEISAKDHFKANNKFMKSVKVEPRPKILLVSHKESPSAQIFSSIYDVTKTTTVPNDISKYSALIINDIKAETLPIEQLTNHVLDGNGLFVIGGKNSFDKDSYKAFSYKPYEALMPVTVGQGKQEKKKEVNVVILMDISGSTGTGFSQSPGGSTVQEVEKAIALSILNDLKKTDSVGVIAFESVPHKVADIQRKEAHVKLDEKIKTIAYGKGTDIASGIGAAIEMLNKASGSKSIILISDGIPGGPAADDIRMARAAGGAGIRMFAVGVGARTNTLHMQEMAQVGRGFYFEPTETQRIKIILGESEEVNDTYTLEIVNNYHFITKGVNLKAKATGYNFVIPKSSAQLLVTTQANEPILTAWRFGLGRIAALSTDDGSSWNGEMLSKENSGLLSKTTNWVIGDLSRNKEFDVDMEDTYLGDEIEINVVSTKPPTSPDLNFTKIGEKLYTSTYLPKESGFYRFFDAVVAVNYDKELKNVGENPELEKLVMVTGGQMFGPEEYDDIIAKVKTDSKRVKTDNKSLSWMFLLGAMGLFLLDIALRRIIETKRINKQ